MDQEKSLTNSTWKTGQPHAKKEKKKKAQILISHYTQMLTQSGFKTGVHYKYKG